MKYLAILPAILLTLGLYAQDGDYKINLTKSSLKWTGKKITGQHTGYVKIKNGELNLKNGKINGGRFEIDMNTITCTDIKDENTNQKLIKHLKSDDFFSVDKFPVSKLAITKSMTTDGKNYDLTADLIIKGISNPVNYKAVVDKNGTTMTIKATIVVDRSKYDVKFGSKSFFQGLGDNMIYDDFEVEVTLQIDMK